MESKTKAQVNGHPVNVSELLTSETLHCHESNGTISGISKGQIHRMVDAVVMCPPQLILTAGFAIESNR